MKRFFAIATCIPAAIALATMAGSVRAQDPADSPEAKPQPTTPADVFQQLDSNKDGSLQRDEVPEAQTRFFDRLIRTGDTNSDGILSRAEFDKATAEATESVPTAGGFSRRPEFDGAPDPEQFFRRFDTNQDGKLTVDELPEFLRDRVRRSLESTGRDAITRDDLQRLRSLLQPPGGANPNPGTTRPGAGPGGAEFFNRLDRNEDGLLTRDELPEQAHRLFDDITRITGRESVNLEAFQSALERIRERDSGSATAQPPGSPQTPSSERRPEDRQPGRDGGPQLNPGMRPEGTFFAGPAFFRSLDQNRDGRLSREELSRAASLLDELDANQDGSLDPREMYGVGMGPRPDAASGDQRPRRPDSDSPETSGDRGTERRPETDRPQTDRTDTPRPRQGGTPDRFDPQAVMQRLDQNKDGVLDRNEAPQRLKDNFERVDTNKDGGISGEELKAAFERVQGRDA